MKVSKKFLNDYIDISDLDYKTLAEDLVSVGNEYDEEYKLVDAQGLVVGKIIECKKHPQSKKLSICQVDLGKEKVQILCGAPNVKTNQKVIVATVGAQLPGSITIKKASLAGMESNGMICSLAELGIESKYLTEEDKIGIHVLPQSARIGEDAVKTLELDDEIIDFDFTSNRADMLSYIGIAYEVGAVYNKKIMYPKTKIDETNGTNDYQIDVQTDNCYIYLGQLVQNITVKESPLFIKNRLMASGIRPINNVVDISNYVMLEYGQPLHFFDSDKLGKKVIVRMSKEKEQLKTLDGITRTLSNEDIVIANEKGPVALAGVMGGTTTEVEDTTTNIFIESAIFNPVNIRRTSKRIIRSEASNRYEKGIDPNRTEEALKRAAYLLNKYAQGQVTKGISKYDKINKNDKKITITLEKINKVLGLQLNKKEIINCLTKLKFQVIEKNKIFTVMVPTRRLDVNIQEDIIEEIGRIYGYDKIKGILPKLSLKTGGYSNLELYTKDIKNRLQVSGFNEVITYSLISEKECNLFNDLKNKVIIANPISEERKIMRSSLLPSLLGVFNYNLARNNQNIAIFEIGSVYSKEDTFIEKPCVSGLMYGEYIANYWQNIKIKVDFYTIKGIIENLLQYLGFNNRYSFIEEDIQGMHPKKTAQILIDKKPIGFIGEVHPSISKKPVYVFEISMQQLMEFKVKDLKNKEISKYPNIVKDISFVVDKEIISENIKQVIKKAGGRLLKNIDVFDLYEGDKIEPSKKSIAYSLTFADTNRTLLDEEINNLMKKIEEQVCKQVHAVVRK